MDKAKKKRIKRYITWGAMAAVVALLAAMPLLARQEAEADGPVASILSAQVQSGAISSALKGGGTLGADGAEDVTIPTGVKITEFLVKNGDRVTTGMPLAAVDRVSVMTAITGVTDTLEYLQDELESARDESVDSTIAATAGGRVKKVFAKEGERVQEVMLRDGALALLSIDGLMAVKIERSLDVRTGESVMVTVSDGTEVTGRVESNLDGVVVITVEDEGYTIGEQVTVTAEDGQRLGAGTLYVHNAWKATAFSGTISTVSAKEEKTVSSGATLFALKDTEYTGRMEYLAGKHREYEELLQDLFRMYESGTIDAPCDGVISGVDEDSVHLLSAVPETWQAVPLNTVTENGGDKGWTVVLLSNIIYADGECGSDTCPLVGEHTVAECPMNVCSGTESCTANADQHIAGVCAYYCDMSPTCANANHKSGCLSICTGNDANCMSELSAAYHKKSCSKRCVADTDPDTDVVCDANVHKEACIENCNGKDDGSCTAINHKTTCYFYGMTYTAYAAKVTAVGNGDLVVLADTTTVYEVKPGWTLVNPTTINTNLMIMETTVPVGTGTYAAGDIILIVTGTKGGTVAYSDVVVYQQAESDDNSGSTGDMDISGMIGSFSGFGNFNFGATAPVEEEELYDLEGSTLMTVTPQDTMTLTITLDEHDIAKVSLGDEATIKVEALRGQVFAAEVSKIAISGTNNGGSSKFAVELTLEMGDNMLAGMSATATIPLETRKNVAMLPVEALEQQGARTVVYTALDKNGEPANPVEVETGLSDGKHVEILSGVSLGDTIYYSYYDILELDTSAEADKYSFG